MSACNSRHRCRDCQKKHHTPSCPLCNSGQDSNSSSQSSHTVQQSNSTPPSQPATAAAKNTSNGTTDTASMSMTIPAPQSSVCLLKTAVATVTNGKKRTKANLLFDEGSQKSFITEDLAKALALRQLCKEDIIVSTFGAQRQLNREVSVAKISLLTLSGQPISITVLVVPRIATPLQNTVTLSVTRLPHLQSLTLAHPLTAEKEFNISLLVGADHYWDIFGNNVIRGDGSTAVESKLGYLLS